MLHHKLTDIAIFYNYF